MSKVFKHRVVEDLDHPCSDISFRYVRGTLSIDLLFSGVHCGYASDIEARFDSPIIMSWEDESYSHMDIPDDLPRCNSESFASWTYPMLKISDSKVISTYSAIVEAYEGSADSLTQYVFVSMNDLIWVLATEDPEIVIGNTATSGDGA